MEKAVEKVAEEKASDVEEKVSDAAVVVKRFQPLKKAAPATKVRTTLKKKA
jgi:hypothetical protein